MLEATLFFFLFSNNPSIILKQHLVGAAASASVAASSPLDCSDVIITLDGAHAEIHYVFENVSQKVFLHQKRELYLLLAATTNNNDTAA